MNGGKRDRSLNPPASCIPFLHVLSCSLGREGDRSLKTPVSYRFSPPVLSCSQEKGGGRKGDRSLNPPASCTFFSLFPPFSVLWFPPFCSYLVVKYSTIMQNLSQFLLVPASLEVLLPPSWLTPSVPLPHVILWVPVPLSPPLPGSGVLYDRVEDARHRAKGYKLQILV